MSSIPSYPDKLEITPLSRPPSATVRVPGSKSITNRALMLAALSGNSGYDCELRGALRSEDTEVMCDALRRWASGSERIGRPQWSESATRKIKNQYPPLTQISSWRTPARLCGSLPRSSASVMAVTGWMAFLGCASVQLKTSFRRFDNWASMLIANKATDARRSSWQPPV